MSIGYCQGFCLSFRDIEDLLAECEIVVSYETIRSWCIKFSVPDRGSVNPSPLGDGLKTKFAIVFNAVIPLSLLKIQSYRFLDYFRQGIEDDRYAICPPHSQVCSFFIQVTASIGP